MASVTIRHLTKTFDPSGTPALQDFSLEVPEGERLVLLGPSGSGKSTLLRCIAGLELPSTGEVLLGDRDVTRLRPADRNVALVLQRHSLYPHLTVRENIAFSLEVRGVPRLQVTRRVLNTAERLGIDQLLDRRPAQLSGGEQQRVALGRALIREPSVLLLDEPLVHLDAPARSALRGELLRLHGMMGTTMILVTHDQTEAMTLGQRVAVLDAGRLRQTGTPSHVYRAPAEISVARLLGSPGMNILAGTASHKKQGTVVTCGPLTIPVPLREYDGWIQLGVRPEHVRLCGVDEGMGVAMVRLVEPLGPDTVVHLDAEAVPLVARVAGFPTLAVGERVGIAIDGAEVHFFDSSGVRLP